jgi:transposase-like protein
MRNRHAARNEAIASMYLSGQTLEATGAAYNLTRQRVYQILTAMGIDVPAVREARTRRTIAEKDLARRTCPICGTVWQTGYGFRHMGLHRRGGKQPEREAEIVARYLAGEKSLAIQRDMNISAPVLYRALRRANVPKRRNTHRGTTTEARERQAKITEMLLSHQYTQKQIADEVGCSLAWVGNIKSRLTGGTP